MQTTLDPFLCGIGHETPFSVDCTSLLGMLGWVLGCSAGVLERSAGVLERSAEVLVPLVSH